MIRSQFVFVMDGWTHGWTDVGWMDTWMDTWMDGGSWIDGWMATCWMDGCTDRWMDGQMLVGWMDYTCFFIQRNVAVLYVDWISLLGHTHVMVQCSCFMTRDGY